MMSRRRQEERNGMTNETQQLGQCVPQAEAGTAPAPGEILIRCNENERTITPADLLFEEGAECAAIDEFCQSGGCPPVFVLTPLLDWDDSARWELFKFIVQVSGVCEAEVDGEVRQFASLFEAVLALLEDHENIERCVRGQYAAVEAAVLVYPNDLEIATSKIAKHFKILGVQGLSQANLLKRAKTMVAELHPRGNDRAMSRHFETPPLVHDILEDAPVPADVCVPAQWYLSEHGISRRPDNGDEAEGLVEPTISAPTVITKRLREPQSGRELLEIAWRREGHWQTLIVERSKIATSRDIVELSAFGFPVTSNNAAVVVQYLADFEFINLENLPLVTASSQLGWIGEDGSGGFLLGKTHIVPPAPAGTERAPSKNSTAPSQVVVFRGADDGNEQLVDGFQAKGSLEGWKSTVHVVEHFPRIRLGLYAALAATLLRIFRVSNFVLDYSGETSTGKTSTLRLLASCWGNPDENSPASALYTWDSTRVARERTMATLCDLPTIYDDTKRARNPKEVAQALYDAVSGRGRARGNIKGLASVDTYHTILITSGEAPATSFSEDGGTRARTLMLWGPPFDSANAKTGQIVHRLNTSLRDNYGHAGPLLIKYLLANRNSWGQWREEFAKLQAVYQAQAGDNSIAHRMSAAFAVIEMAAKLAHEASIFPWEYANPIESLWEELVTEAKEADRAAAALELAMSWARSHQKDFCNGSNTTEQPTHGWAGRWDFLDIPKSEQATVLRQLEQEERESNWICIGFYPERLREILVGGEFDYTSTIRTWKDRGWLKTNAADNKNTCRTRIGNTAPRLITIKRSAVIGIENPEQLQARGQDPADADSFADQQPSDKSGDDAEPVQVQVYAGQAV
jgi:putative DNA primase/helicase